MPPTMPTIAFVVNGTRLSPPVHGPACCRNPWISSCSFLRSTSEVVIIMNESSVSRLAEREFRFVEPNKVATGAESGVGDSHMPVEHPGQHWLVSTTTLHTFCVICPVCLRPKVQLNAFSICRRPLTPGGGHRTHESLF